MKNRTIESQVATATAAREKLERWGERYNRQAGTTAGGAFYWVEKPWFGLTTKQWAKKQAQEKEGNDTISRIERDALNAGCAI